MRTLAVQAVPQRFPNHLVGHGDANCESSAMRLRSSDLIVDEWFEDVSLPSRGRRNIVEKTKYR
jgi:hypothetical protein